MLNLVKIFQEVKCVNNVIECTFVLCVSWHNVNTKFLFGNVYKCNNVGIQFKKVKKSESGLLKQLKIENLLQNLIFL